MAGKISKNCELCGEMFSRWPSQMKGVKYCSMKCRKLGQSKEVVCGWCGKKERRAKSLCVGMERSFCSKKCHDLYQGRNRVKLICECCDKKFTTSEADMRRSFSVGKKRRFCSSECARKVMQGEQHPRFKEGTSVAADGGCLALYDEKTIAGGYVRVHRLIVEEIIGRKLLHSEHVIHISRDKKDNHPRNLYVCDSISECQCILNGSLPFPKNSNLPDLSKGKK